jgi:hypothetical protein
MVCREVDVEEEIETSFRGDSADVTYGDAPPSVLGRKIDLRTGDV